MNMQVRFPIFDSTKFRARWAPNAEFAQFYNAFSIVPAHIEPYLIKVMMRARKQLDREHAELNKDMEIFIRQETQHCKQHVAFNNFMYEAGYGDMRKVEEEYKAEYHRFISKRSLRFNLAYCEGFEALGSASAEIWFHGDIDELIKDADPYAVQLWKWHLAEEFEHRTVCYDAFKTLYAQGFWKSIVFGYFYRVWAFLYATRHINSYTERCARVLLAIDRNGLSPEELRKSQEREKAMKKIIGRATLPRLAKVLLPWYNPRHKKMPKNMEELLKHYAATQPVT